jgi:L-asparaginase II
MSNPILVEVTRGGLVESRHRGAMVVVDADGTVLLGHGDVDAAIFPRSAIKVLQAIPLIESGAADAYGFGNRELALACASHSGEAGHVALAAHMLGRAGLDASALECGCHWPFGLSQALDIARDGQAPTPLHNNCSGKHAGFLCTAVHRHETTAGYVGATHPVQRRAQAVIEDLTGTVLGPDVCGTDGCSIPTFAAPLRGFATAFAKLVSGRNVEPVRAQAGQRLIAACIAEPWYMAGTDRACVKLIEAGQGRVFAKTGAEGVFCGAVPEFGLGFAVKIDDGTTRASEAAVAALLVEIFRPHDAGLAEAYAELSRSTLHNWEKTVVGEVRAVVLD